MSQPAKPLALRQLGFTITRTDTGTPRLDCSTTHVLKIDNVWHTKHALTRSTSTTSGTSNMHSLTHSLTCSTFSSSVLLDTTFSRLVFFVTVTCPCSSTTKCHANLFVYNNNNNNNNNWRRLTRQTWYACVDVTFDKADVADVGNVQFSLISPRNACFPAT